jgi:actin-like ATPase involved in cell morphogenesis
MGYQLGIDFGTTYTAAAICRDGLPRIAPLGMRAAVIPSVLLLGKDGTVLTGDAANRRAVAEADRVAREFKRRIGDPTPLVVGGVGYSAEALVAKLFRWVVDKVSEAEGEPPQRLAITYPASWGPYKQDAFAQAVRMAELGDVEMLTEPEAAAISYAAAERVDAGSTVAVYDLGGGTFDAVVLRKTREGFDLLGAPEGIEHLGGADFDETVFAHVVRALGPGTLEQLDPHDPTALMAVARLRQECVDAKEALSSDTDVSIPVLLPNLRTQVRLVRSEFEAMIRPAVSDTIAALRRAMRSAQVEPQGLSAVLLVGGSSRIPLVAQMVSAELGRPVALDAHPKHATALGAALSAAGQASRTIGDADPVPARAAGPAGEPSVTQAVDTQPPARPPLVAPSALHFLDPNTTTHAQRGATGGYLPTAQARRRGTLAVVLAVAALGAVAVLPLLWMSTGSSAPTTPFPVATAATAAPAVVTPVPPAPPAPPAPAAVAPVSPKPRKVGARPRANVPRPPANQLPLPPPTNPPPTTPPPPSPTNPPPTTPPSPSPSPSPTTSPPPPPTTPPPSLPPTPSQQRPTRPRLGWTFPSPAEER